MKGDQSFFSFAGRISRDTFWGIGLILFFLSLLSNCIIWEFISSEKISLLVIGIILYILYAVPCIWIGLSMQIRRWHDRGKSGWMVLINLIPIIGQIWAFVELGFLKGVEGANSFGDDPLESQPKIFETKCPLCGSMYGFFDKISQPLMCTKCHKKIIQLN